MLVTRSHLDEIEPRYCARGARRWAARLGLDWTDFVQHGIPVEKLEQTGDAMALKLAEFVRSRRDCIQADRNQHGI